MFLFLGGCEEKEIHTGLSRVPMSEAGSAMGNGPDKILCPYSPNGDSVIEHTSFATERDCLVWAISASHKLFFYQKFYFESVREAEEKKVKIVLGRRSVGSAPFNVVE
jgi:hypothetical protein